ncbi:hypothetical protein [Inhella sp.]|uniref:hypothetical protein n=1 Tax=Inhella sp. TaxID=1921806 RepID=UPI0035B1FD5B
MQGLASFDRCLAQRHAFAAPAARSDSRPRLNRYLIGPLADQVLPLAATADARTLLKLAHDIGPGDWLGVLAEEGGSHTPAWRLAVCRAAGGLEWLSPAWHARAGTAPHLLQQELQARAVQALWTQGWRVLDGLPAVNTPA